MFQRKANMKPASFANHDNPSIRIHSLIKFVDQAQKACESRGEEDAAFRFECFKQWLEMDYRSGKPFEFSTTAIGM